MDAVTSCLICRVCDHALAFRWTDTHGIAVCVECGLPYRVYHYNEHNERIEKPPECVINDLWLPLAREYWSETHMPVFPGANCIVLRDGVTYSGHTSEEIQAFDSWLEGRRKRWPNIPEDYLVGRP
jgi:hypothetical protein